ncbi:MAG: phosphopantetheine-binding protein [Pseudomonadota bacterium]
MSAEADLAARLLEMLEARAPDAKGLTVNNEIVADTGLDSVDVMDLVMEVEDEFDVTIPLDQIATVKTIAEMAAVVAAVREREKT